MKFGISIIILLLAIVAFVFEFILYSVLGISIFLAGDLSALSGIAIAFTFVMVLTVATGVLAPICALIELIVKKKNIGVYTMMVLLGIISIALVYMTSINRTNNLVVEKSFSAMKEAVISNIPANVAADDVSKIFDETVLKIKTGEFDKTKMQEIATVFQTSFHDQVLDSTEIVLILNSLKDFNTE